MATKNDQVNIIEVDRSTTENLLGTIISVPVGLISGVSGLEH